MILDVSLVSLIVISLESRVSEGLINFLVDRDSQGLFFSSFNPIKFTSGVFSDIFKVF